MFSMSIVCWCNWTKLATNMTMVSYNNINIGSSECISTAYAIQGRSSCRMVLITDGISEHVAHTCEGKQVLNNNIHKCLEQTKLPNTLHVHIVFWATILYQYHGACLDNKWFYRNCITRFIWTHGIVSGLTSPHYNEYFNIFRY